MSRTGSALDATSDVARRPPPRSGCAVPADRRTVSECDTPIATAPIICTEGLGACYGRQVALDDVTLDIERRGITAVIGPSGCGKTTFLTCLNRLTDLIPGCRVTGRVTIGSTDALAPTTDVIALRRRVGMIFQKPNPFPLSIRKNIGLAVRDHGLVPRAEIDAVVASALRQVGLWDEVKDRLDAPAGALSGGQQQRLCIARALALKPEVLLFDEPCSALDPISSGVVEDLIVRLGRRYTLVVVTHNLAQARRIADRVALFWLQEGRGRLIEQGPCRRVFDAPAHELTARYVTGQRG